MPAFVTLARNTWTVTPVDGQRTRVTYAGELQVGGSNGSDGHSRRNASDDGASVIMFRSSSGGNTAVRDDPEVAGKLRRFG